jgi:hypothetical protein
MDAKDEKKKLDDVWTNWEYRLQKSSKEHEDYDFKIQAEEKGVLSPITANRSCVCDAAALWLNATTILFRDLSYLQPALTVMRGFGGSLTRIEKMRGGGDPHKYRRWSRATELVALFPFSRSKLARNYFICKHHLCATCQLMSQVTVTMLRRMFRYKER